MVAAANPLASLRSAVTAVIPMGGLGGAPLADRYFPQHVPLDWIQSLTRSGHTALATGAGNIPHTGIYEGTQNLHQDPFGVTVTNYYASNNGGVVSGLTGQTDTPFDGVTTAVQVACPGSAGNEGVQFGNAVTSVAVTAGQPYTFSLNAKTVSGSTDCILRVRWYTSAPAFISESSQAVTIPAAYGDESDRLELTATAPGTAAYALLLLSTNGTFASTFAVSGVQFENKAYRTPTCGGTVTGDAWDSTANASTSTRTASDIASGSAAYTDETTFGAIVWVRWPFANTLRSSGDLILRDWRDDANNRITLRYDLANARYGLLRTNAAGGTELTKAVTFASGDDHMIAIGGSSSGLTLDVNALSRATSTDTSIPTLSATSLDYGHAAGSSQVNAPFGSCIELNRGPTDSERFTACTVGPFAAEQYLRAA